MTTTTITPVHSLHPQMLADGIDSLGAAHFTSRLTRLFHGL